MSQIIKEWAELEDKRILEAKAKVVKDEGKKEVWEDTAGRDADKSE